jgi:5-hydroxyisourate hydrolase-like protein (transthyretin family)
MPIVAETPFVVDDFESPLVSDETPRKKRKIVRRSGHACRQLLPEKNLSIDHRTSTPQDMDLESTKGDEAMPIDDAASVESDFELTFASHYSPLPTLAASASSTEPPFLGFEAIEVEVPTTHLEQIRQVIDNDQMESVEEGNAAEKVSAQLPPPTAPVEITAIAGPSTAKIPTPRRSSRRPVPNTRRTFDISEPNLEPVATKRRPGRPPKAANKIEIQSSNESDASEPVTAIKRRPGRQAKGIKVEVKSSENNVSEPVVTAITRKPGRQAKGLKVEVKSSDEDVSEPVVTAITRKPGRQAKGLKVEVKSSDEDVSEPVVTAITRKPGRQAKGLKVEIKSSDEDVSEPVVTAAVKRRPGRPPKIEASIPKEPSETMKPVIPKASTSVLLSDAAESSEENRATNLRTSRKTRVGRKEKDVASVSVVEPPTSPLLAKRTPRNQVKKELADGSLLESALNKTTVAAQRRSRRSVNNNRDDLSVTSSVGSNSPSIQEATRRRKRALAGQVIKQ